MMAFTKRISIWGIASLIILVGEFFLQNYNDRLLINRQKPLWPSATGFQLCVVFQLAAAVCGVVAIRRGGSRWWLMCVLVAILIALSCYFGEV